MTPSIADGAGGLEPPAVTHFATNPIVTIGGFAASVQFADRPRLPRRESDQHRDSQQRPDGRFGPDSDEEFRRQRRQQHRDNRDPLILLRGSYSRPRALFQRDRFAKYKTQDIFRGKANLALARQRRTDRSCGGTSPRADEGPFAATRKSPDSRSSRRSTTDPGERVFLMTGAGARRAGRFHFIDLAVHLKRVQAERQHSAAFESSGWLALGNMTSERRSSGNHDFVA